MSGLRPTPPFFLPTPLPLRVTSVDQKGRSRALAVVPTKPAPDGLASRTPAAPTCQGGTSLRWYHLRCRRPARLGRRGSPRTLSRDGRVCSRDAVVVGGARPGCALRGVRRLAGACLVGKMMFGWWPPLAARPSSFWASQRGASAAKGVYRATAIEPMGGPTATRSSATRYQEALPLALRDGANGLPQGQGERLRRPCGAGRVMHTGVLASGAYNVDS